MDARLLLLDTYADRGDWASLKTLATETLSLAPNDPEAQRFARLQPRQASPVSQPASQAPEALLILSLTAYQRMDYDGCIRFAEAALKQKPDYAEAYNNIAAAYSALRQWDQAIHAAQEALRIKPDFQLARNNLQWAVSAKKMANPSR